MRHPKMQLMQHMMDTYRMLVQTQQLLQPKSREV